MDEVLVEIKKRTEVQHILDKYGFSRILLRQYFILQAKGYNNKDIAKETGVHRSTIQRYSKKLKELLESEFVTIHTALVNEASVMYSNQEG